MTPAAGSHSESGTVAITATAATGYSFSEWTSTGTITFDSAASASTNAHIGSAGTVTANFVPNAIEDGSFENSTGGTWVAGGSQGSNGPDVHFYSTDIPAHSGGHVCEIDSTSINRAGLQYDSATEPISPTVPVKDIPNQAGTLVVWIYNAGPGTGGYYYFEVIVSAVSGSTTYQLIYFYHVSSVPVPANNSTTVYIDMGSPANLPLDTWTALSRNLYSDWTTSNGGTGLPSSVNISSIEIINYGYYTSANNIQGNELYLDDILLDYNT